MKTVKLTHAKDPDLTKVCRNAFIDWHAASHMVDYYNYKCAERAMKQGYVLNDSDFASKDFAIPEAPLGVRWSEATALKELHSGSITREKYGYILGMLEMEYRRKMSEAKSDLESGRITKEEFESIKNEAIIAFFGTSTT
ncbi:hypothetical protein GL2_25140 [Microbulbifer sp. GL-2]|nr:hypothetical protein GL2_25140 [Microbulbifer sp. GL-2]